MKRRTVTVFIILLFASFAHSKTCVLSLLLEHSPIQKMVDEAYDRLADFSVFKTASLQEIQQCFESEEYEEIIFIAHGTSVKFGLGQYSTPIIFDPNKNQKFPIPVRFFQNLAKTMNVKRLKSLRIAVCNLSSPESKFPKSTLEVLTEEALRRGISVEFSPVHWFGRRLLGENVTALTNHWLSQSIDRKGLTRWRTEQNTKCESDSWPGCNRFEAEWVLPLNTGKSRRNFLNLQTLRPINGRPQGTFYEYHSSTVLLRATRDSAGSV